MASGVKITNDGESIINAALALSMLHELYPLGKIKMLQTMGDDLIIVLDMPNTLSVSIEDVSKWY